MKNRVGTGICLTLALVGVLEACASSAPAPAEDQLDALRNEVHQTVTDKVRANAILGQIDQMEGLLVELGETVVRHNEEIRTLVRDYDTIRPEIEAAFARFLEERQRFGTSLAGAHHQLKAQATAKVWKKLAKKEKAAIDWAANRHFGEVTMIDGGA